MRTRTQERINQLKRWLKSGNHKEWEYAHKNELKRLMGEMQAINWCLENLE